MGTEALNMSCLLKHMAAAACGQCTKSQTSSGGRPSTKGGVPTSERKLRLDCTFLHYLADEHALCLSGCVLSSKCMLSGSFI